MLSAMNLNKTLISKIQMKILLLRIILVFDLKIIKKNLSKMKKRKRLSKVM